MENGKVGGWEFFSFLFYEVVGNTINHLRLLLSDGAEIKAKIS